MIFTVNVIVETDNEYNKEQLTSIVDQLTGDILHDLSCGSRHGAVSLEEGSRVIIECTENADGQGVDIVSFTSWNLLPKSEWESFVVFRDGQPAVDSEATDACQPRSVVNAEAVPAQLELFKSVRRPVATAEMMAEVVEFCNRG